MKNNSMETVEVGVEKIFEKLTNDQTEAVRHCGSHARLLAGPGSGKTLTLTHRVLSLVLEKNVDPKSILLLTFTRLAARQLCEKINEVLKPYDKESPTVSTLHSFALRQLLMNSNIVNSLPTPIRIADDWEERNIIQEDIKTFLGTKRIDDVQKLFNRLSANWETLNADEEGWEENFEIPQFITAFKQHKGFYSETLRAELVYQLKKSLEQNQLFRLDKDYAHILIDEYQDLNPCDLAIVKLLSERGAEIFVVGDDDQSIYGFRYANPRGIREFPTVYPDTKRLALETCYRCDKKIFSTAEFVANLDLGRLPKKTKPREDADDGDVKLVGFVDQYKEAITIAKKIESLIKDGIQPKEICLLFRGSKNKLVAPIIKEFKTLKIPYRETAGSEIEEKKEYRVVLSFLRLSHNQNDGLSLRTLIELEKNKIGEKCIEEIHKVCEIKKKSFADTLLEIKHDESITKNGVRVSKYFGSLEEKIDKYRKIENLVDLFRMVIDENVENGETRETLFIFFKSLIGSEEQKLEDFLRSLNSISDQYEQEEVGEGVSLLTMHQAKGLTFDVVFIVGVEDEFIPGKNDSTNPDDERRLLYVSMTRARHKLYMTYCNRRVNDQRHTGRNAGVEGRTLTRFLADIPSLVPLQIR